MEFSLLNSRPLLKMTFGTATSLHPYASGICRSAASVSGPTGLSSFRVNEAQGIFRRHALARRALKQDRSLKYERTCACQSSRSEEASTVRSVLPVSTLQDASIVYGTSTAAGHTSGGHPECKERVEAITTALQAAGFLDSERQQQVLQLPKVELATPSQISAVHSQAYVRGLEKIMERAAEEGLLTLESSGPTFATSSTYADCLQGSGIGIALVDCVAAASSKGAPAPSGYAIVRPPGHHAVKTGPMGFCLVDHIAVAARHAQIVHGLRRVLVVDFDVHHGNGTHDIFYSDPDVFFLSTHQLGSYPGTGRMRDVGDGPGEGATMNLPLPGGAGHEAMLAVMDEVIAPAALQFKPDIILVSAGYDAHYEDVLAGMQFTCGTYFHLAKGLRELSLQLCGGRLVFFLEGGYGLRPLSNSVVETFRAVMGESSHSKRLDNPAMLYDEPSVVVRKAIDQLKSIHGL